MALQVLRTFTDVEDERGAVLVGRVELLDRDLSHEVLRSVGSVVSLNTIYPYGYFTRLGIRLSQYPVGYSLTQAVLVPQGVHHVSSRHVPPVRQGHLGRLWPARRPGAGRRSARPAVHVRARGEAVLGSLVLECHHRSLTRAVSGVTRPSRVPPAGPGVQAPVPPRQDRCPRLAQRVEGGELGDPLARDHLLGQQPAGDRAQGDPPHAVSTGGEDARGLRAADEGQAVGRAGSRAHPLVLAVVEVDPAQQRTGSLGDGPYAPLVKGGLGAAEIHHPGHPKAVADGRAGNALGREVDRAVGDVIGRHAEAVAAAGLDDPAHAELARELAEPRAGRQHDRVEGLTAALGGHAVDTLAGL